MKFKQFISIFVPAYNEEDNLREVSADILNFLEKNFEKYEFIIVANVSKDKTQEIAKDIEKKNKHVRAILQKDFVGYGTQLKTGWENAKGDLIFYTDSDRQFNIQELKKFMPYLSKYDAVIGYRLDRKDPKMRIFYSRLYNLALRVLLGLKFRDIDCAFKICHRRVVEAIKPLTEDRSADSEFLVKTVAAGFKIKQLPVTHRPRIAGVSEAESNSKGFFVRIKPEIIIALIKETMKLRKFKK